MKHLSPEGGRVPSRYAVGQSGRRRVGPATTLALVAEPGFHERLAASTRQLADGLATEARAAGLDFASDAVGGMFGFYFTDDLPRALADVTASDIERFKRFFHAMLDRGVYFAPSAYEAGFVSGAHDAATIEATIAAAREVFATLA